MYREKRGKRGSRSRRARRGHRGYAVHMSESNPRGPGREVPLDEEAYPPPDNPRRHPEIPGLGHPAQRSDLGRPARSNAFVSGSWTVQRRVASTATFTSLGVHREHVAARCAVLADEVPVVSRDVQRPDVLGRPDPNHRAL